MQQLRLRKKDARAVHGAPGNPAYGTQHGRPLAAEILRAGRGDGRRAHAQLESGRAKGKIVLEGY